MRYGPSDSTNKATLLCGLTYWTPLSNPHHTLSIQGYARFLMKGIPERGLPTLPSFGDLRQVTLRQALVSRIFPYHWRVLSS